MALSGDGSGPAGISAANALGLSTQIAARPLVAVVGRKPTGLSGVRFTQRSNFERRTLTSSEVALLEVLRVYPAHVEVEWAELVSRVAALIDEGAIRLRAVERAALSEQQANLRHTMGRLTAALKGVAEAASS